MHAPLPLPPAASAPCGRMSRRSPGRSGRAPHCRPAAGRRCARPGAARRCAPGWPRAAPRAPAATRSARSPARLQGRARVQKGRGVAPPAELSQLVLFATVGLPLPPAHTSVWGSQAAAPFLAQLHPGTAVPAPPTVLARAAAGEVAGKHPPAPAKLHQARVHHGPVQQHAVKLPLQREGLGAVQPQLARAAALRQHVDLRRQRRPRRQLARGSQNRAGCLACQARGRPAGEQGWSAGVAQPWPAPGRRAGTQRGRTGATSR